MFQYYVILENPHVDDSKPWFEINAFSIPNWNNCVSHHHESLVGRNTAASCKAVGLSELRFLAIPGFPQVFDPQFFSPLVLKLSGDVKILKMSPKSSSTPTFFPLVGGIPTPLKIWKSVGMLGLLFPTEWKNNIHVPNHQPRPCFSPSTSPSGPPAPLGWASRNPAAGTTGAVPSVLAAAAGHAASPDVARLDRHVMLASTLVAARYMTYDEYVPYICVILCFLCFNWNDTLNNDQVLSFKHGLKMLTDVDIFWWSPHHPHSSNANLSYW